MKSGATNLKGFELHGVEFQSSANGQRIGDCPFCSKEKHFYVNDENRLWDCKRCGASGNFSQFLSAVAKKNQENLNSSLLSKISVDRRLPASAFNSWGLGWSTTAEAYTLPCCTPTGACRDLRVYKAGMRSRATPGASLCPLGGERLGGAGPVYLCEGEWDAIALNWLLKKVESEGIALGIPGANVFKSEWASWFSERNVTILYDNDQAGKSGMRSASQILQPVCKNIKYVQWPDGLESGFDVRDLVSAGIKVPRRTWKTLQSFMSSAMEDKRVKGSAKIHLRGRPINHKEVMKSYRKWLFLPSSDPLLVMFGAVFANRIPGDPLWIFLVAPPGGLKSELIMSLRGSDLIEALTSLTPHALVSGAFTSGGDPSLIPKLNNRILAIKDFTTILTMHYVSRDQIFGTLRDAYDGHIEWTWGSGLKRSYDSRFGIIAGVTPAIEAFNTMHQSLGERFLKYRIRTDREISDAERIRRAMQNINHEPQMRTDLQTVAKLCIDQPIPKKLPIVPEDIMMKIINLAQFTAMLRGVVERDRYSQDVMFKPVSEIGTRLGKQLTKLGMGIAIYLKLDKLNETVYRIIREVALDSCPDRVEDIVRQMYLFHLPETVTAQVSEKTRLPVTTCFRILQDLNLLRVVNRSGSLSRYAWTLTEHMIKLIQGGSIYEKEGSLQSLRVVPRLRLS